MDFAALYKLERYFMNVFWTGIFGVFIWFELPLNILAMLVHPTSKPSRPLDDMDEHEEDEGGDEGSEMDEGEPDAI